MLSPTAIVLLRESIEASIGRKLRTPKDFDILAETLNGIGVSCANIPAGYHNPHKDDEYTVIAELEHSLSFIRHFITTEHRRFPHTFKTYTQQMIEETVGENLHGMARD